MINVATSSKKVRRIKISADYSASPAGRGPGDGAFNGERFRQEFMLSGLRDFDEIQLDLSDLSHYLTTSFLDEGFKALISKEGMAPEFLEKRITIVSGDELDIQRVRAALAGR